MNPIEERALLVTMTEILLELNEMKGWLMMIEKNQREPPRK